MDIKGIYKDHDNPQSYFNIQEGNDVASHEAVSSGDLTVVESLGTTQENNNTAFQSPVILKQQSSI